MNRGAGPRELDTAARERILDFVRPLTVGLDGETSFGFVERRLRVVARLAEDAVKTEGRIDDRRLFLLAAFAPVPLRRVAPGGRAELLLLSVGIPREEIDVLSRSLRRLARPESLEEKLVHDAGLLETVGAYGLTQAIRQGTRERLSMSELAEEIDRHMRGAAFATEAGRRLAEDRVAFARAFAERLSREAAEFEPG